MRSERPHFDAIAPHYYDVVDAIWYDSGYYHQRELEIVTRCFGPATSTPLELLDAGSGPGRHTRALAELGHAVTAVDVSPEMAAAASTSAKSTARAHAVAADVRRLPFPAGAFDGVVCVEVLEHLPDYLDGAQDALSEFARVLREEGILVLEAPLQPHEDLLTRRPDLRGSWKELHGALGSTASRQYAEQPLGTWLHFDEASVVDLLSRHGFTLLATCYVRVLPSGLVERLPAVEPLDAVLEADERTQHLAREAVWIAQRVRRVTHTGGGASPAVLPAAVLAGRGAEGPAAEELAAALESSYASLRAHADEAAGLRKQRERQDAALDVARGELADLRARLEQSELAVTEAEELRRRAEEERYEAQRVLTTLQNTTAVRLAGGVWQALNTVLPQGSRRRRAYQLLRSRRRLAHMQHGPQSHDVVRDVLEFQARVRADGADTVAVLLCGTQLVESEGQRPTRLALELARQGTPVVFVYWRWGPGEWAPQDRLEQSILQIPVDMVIGQPGLVADAFTGLRRLAMFEFPYPGFFEVLATLNAAGWTTIYDVIDDWEEFHRVGQADWYEDAFERHLITGVDAVFAINDVLADRVRRMGSDLVEVVGNGLHPQVATRTATRTLERGDVTLGYFGHLTGAWFDWRLVAEVARRAPRWKVYLIGYGGEPDGVALPANVTLLGRKPHHELAAYAANWDVAVIPFKPERLAAGADPIKTYEYLAMGLPVVVTGVHPPPGGEEFVVRVEDADGFLAAAGEAAALPSAHADRRRDFAATCSWERRVQAITDTVSREGQRVGQKSRLFPRHGDDA